MSRTSPAVEAVARLADATGEDYRFVGRLAGGETGAHEVRGPDGARLVVKWDDDPGSADSRRRAVGLTRRLRDEADWPVPHQWTVDAGDRLYVLQDLLPGTPVEQLNHAIVDDLLALHTRRLGLGRTEPGPSMGEHLVDTLVTGGTDYCLHAPLREHDERTAALVARVEAFGRGLRPEQFPTDDLVHWDLHCGNLLAVGGQLTAVIDNDFVTVGDAAFDLVCIAMAAIDTPCDPGVEDRLVAAAFDGLDPVRRNAYAGHLVVRILDWAIRKDRPDEVELWLAQAGRCFDA
jgi:hypothetical protein